MIKLTVKPYNMKSEISKREFETAEKKLNDILAIATKKGGFELLSAREKTALAQYTRIVKSYEDIHYSVPMPQTVQGLIELKMYERKLKQKDIAKLLHTTDTKLSAVMHRKRKPNINLLKAMHEKLGIDGNLLLKVV
jgi:HTH-type transcriptional regulator/antitoxin HigA